jgi:hypothetical protein
MKQKANDPKAMESYHFHSSRTGAKLQLTSKKSEAKDKAF